MITNVGLELAGMVDDNGRLGQRVQTDAILRPDAARIRVSRNTLRYDSRAPLLIDVQKPELLDKFQDLETASISTILKFAQTYGTLSVRAIREKGIYEEDLAVWHDFAARARATLNVASCLHRSVKTNDEDWEQLRPWWNEGWRNLVKPNQARWNQLADVVTAWLRAADVRPCFSWTRDSQGISFTNLNGVDEGQLTMLGALALQIVGAVAQARFIARCSSCGTVYQRTRQAPRGRANYCSSCGRRAALRDAQARFRAKRNRNQLSGIRGVR